MFRLFGAPEPAPPPKRGPGAPPASATTPNKFGPGGGTVAVKKPADEPASTGGFFNLPVAAPAAPAPASDGGIFGSLQLKPAANALGAPSGSTLPQLGGGPPAASGFGFLAPATVDGAASASLPPSSFNFMGATTAADHQSTLPSDLPPTTGFSFVASGGAIAPSTALPELPSVASGFSFVAPGAGGLAAASAPTIGPPSLPLSMPPGGGGSSSSAALPVAVQPAVIKKKKPGFRVGVGRDDSAGEAGTLGAAALGGAGGMLAGLAIHDESGAAESGGAEEAQAGGSGTPRGAGGLLAGMRMHSIGSSLGAVDGTGASGPTGSLQQQAAAGSMLSGLQIHAAGAPEDGLSGAGARGTRAGSGSQSTTSAAQYSGSPVAAGLPPVSSSSSGFGFLGGSIGGGSAPAAPAAPASGTPVRPPVSASSSAVSSHMPSPAGPALPPPQHSARSTSPTARKRGVLAELNEAASRGRTRLADIKHRLRALVEADRAAAADIVAQRDRLTAAEAAQDDAIRSEAFDRAETLNATLDAIRAAVGEAEAKRKRVAGERARVEAEQEEAFSDALVTTGEALVGLRSYLDERQGALVRFAREAVAAQVATRDKMASEEEQLRLKEAHAARDRDLVAEETAQVAATIAQQTNEFEGTARDIRTRHAELVSEVGELERLLALKRKEERAAAAALVEAEARIKGIHAKFDKQGKRLASKQAAVEAEAAECEADARAIASERVAFLASRRSNAVRADGLARQIAATTRDVATAEALRAALLEQAERRQGWASTAGQAASAHASHSSAIDAAVRALRGAQGRKAGLEAQAASVRDTLAGIDAKLPALNKEKAAAVAERKFKEAGRLTTEVKRLSDERDAADRELSRLLSDTDACDAEVGARLGEAEAAKAALEAHEAETDAVRSVALRSAIVVLRRALRRIGRATRRAGGGAGARRATSSASATTRRILPGPAPTRQLAGTPITRSVLADLETIMAQSPPEERVDEEEGAAAGTPSPRVQHPEPATDLSLGIESDAASGRTLAQAAAWEMLASERDVLVEELGTLAARHGWEAGLPEESEASEPETGAEEEEPEEEEEGAGSASVATPAKQEESATPAEVSMLSSLSAHIGGAGSALTPTADSPPEPSASSPRDRAATGEDRDSGAAPPATGFSFLIGGGGAPEEGADASAPGALSPSAAPMLSALSFMQPQVAQLGLPQGSNSPLPSLEEGEAAQGFGAPAFPSLPLAHFAAEEDSAPTPTDDGLNSEDAATAAEEHLPAVDPAAERLAELQSMASALTALLAAVREKEDIISEAVGREDYDTADAAQADIDAFFDTRARMMERAGELGVGSEEALQAEAAGM